jgi:catechol 2,3-dioxygenase-like lactoylglutathione lyase family enzyme
MPVLGLDHINIRTSDLTRTIAFFRDVLTMKVGSSPGSTSTENGAWIFDANDVAVVHLANAQVAYPSDGKIPFQEGRGSGALHHVALRCSGFEETLARVKAYGADIYENHMPERGLRQIFVAEANGILFELNFFGDEAKVQE